MSNRFTVTRLESVSSTNNYATTLVNEKKAVDGQIIFTHNQTQGKGYSENKWISQQGQNLTLSVILFPSYLKSVDQFMLSMCVSLAITDFLKKFTPNVYIKWPNDIYVNNCKIAGILIENSMMGNYFYHSVVGIGININQNVFDAELPNPTSLAMETGKVLDIDFALNLLIESLSVRLAELESSQFDKMTESYMSCMYRLNQRSEFITQNERFWGEITGLGDFGQLKLRLDNGSIQNFLFKEIEYVL